MRSLALALCAAFGVVIGGACATRGPEELCEEYVEAACEASARCCREGRKFDRNACRMGLSRTCLELTKAERVHQGELVFNGGAAADCLGDPDSCAAVVPHVDTSFEHTKA